MLQKPAVPDQTIADCLEESYRLPAVHITFLPIGADLGTAVFRVEAAGGKVYFLKLRRGMFEPASVLLPKLLEEQGIGHVIGPLRGWDGRLWARLREPFDEYTAVLSPFVEGRNGYEVGLSDGQFVEFGRLLRRFHTAELPGSLTESVRREGFSARRRQMVLGYLDRVDGSDFEDGIAAETAAFLRSKREETAALVAHAARQAELLRAEEPEFILCHGDIHAGNLHITEDDFYLIDWDTLIMAPKERDLMSIGAGLMGGWRRPEAEEKLFYQGYGEEEAVSRTALNYYRCERIIEDIAVECRQIFGREGGVEDRRQALGWLMSNYEPGGTIELAIE